jgi:spermidine synthase
MASLEPSGPSGPEGTRSASRPARASGHVHRAGPLDNVVMLGERRAGNERDGAGAGAGSRVELLRDLDRPRAWMLVVDGVLQSHVDLDDPRHLELEYVRRLGHLIDLAGPAGIPLRVLHLGGGGLTLARYVAATRPGSCQLAVESDPEVDTAVRRTLPVADPAATGRIDVRIADARAGLAQIPAGSFDLLIADVFAGARTPAHLTSTEFTAAAARVLAPAGIYGLNIGDGPPLAHARGRVATVRSVFAHVCLIAEPAVLRGRRFGNLVILAAQQPLPVAALTRLVAADPFPARLVDGTALDQFTAGSAPITDARAEPSPLPPPEVFV